MEGDVEGVEGWFDLEGVIVMELYVILLTDIISQLIKHPSLRTY